MNRRQFMARTAALNVALSAVPRALAARGLPSRTAPFERVVANRRLAPSMVFAASMAERGTRVSATDGDLTSLWFDDLAKHFAGSGEPIVGLTTARTALVMIELARGPGVHVLWRAEHRPMADGSLHHELQGPAAHVTKVAGLIESTDWVEGLASALDELKEVEAGQAPKMSAVVSAPGAVEHRDETLTSWVLLPRRPVCAKAYNKTWGKEQ